MTFYIVLFEDRHTDSEVYLYADRGDALAEARRMIDHAAAHYRAVPTEVLRPTGLIFRSSIEDGCTVSVEAREVKR